ncbi:SapC family protein [Henriciella litoralis]|uniref:SapC family protein n=1 Tax=Henriciella litoralis TaxID=568102 RepID=UPI001F2370B4|nr:SapC family protein [Henriciella litoralis]
MENSQQSPTAALSGQVLFYSNPQPLSAEKHGGLGLKNIEKPFAFLGKAHAVPVTVTEFAIAATSYPIIFVGADKTPIAAMGIRQDENLFVVDGNVDVDFYVPAFARRYPFVFANDPQQERMLLCVDRDAPMVSNKPDIPFFENGEPTEYTNNAMAFCQEFERQRRGTNDFVKVIDELGLFVERSANYQPRDAEGNDTGPPQTIAQYWAIDEDKLRALPEAKLAELARNGILGACNAHSMSLLNWSRVINRAMRTQAPESAPQPQGGAGGPALQN